MALPRRGRCDSPPLGGRRDPARLTEQPWHPETQRQKQRRPPAVRGASTAKATTRRSERSTFNVQLPTFNKHGKSRPSLLNVERSKLNVGRSYWASTATASPRGAGTLTARQRRRMAGIIRQFSAGGCVIQNNAAGLRAPGFQTNTCTVRPAAIASTCMLRASRY